MIQTKHYTLKNGVRVLLVPNDSTAAAAVLVLHEVGSRYEANRIAGAAHFIEHMMFKGTKRRPGNLEISRELDAVGADYNAFTWRDCTGYYIKLVAEKLPLAVEMLGDILHHSLFDAAAVDQERGVILEEIRMYEDNPLMQVDSLMEEELYRGSSLGRQVAGSVATVGKLTRGDLVEFRDRYYVPKRTVVAVAGRFDEAEVRELLEAHFGQRAEAAKGRSYPRFEIGRAGYRAPRLRHVERETEQIHLALGFPTYGYGHPRLGALTLLNIVLGGTMSSRLFREVREQRGLAYFVRSSVSVYQDVGNLTVQAGIARHRLVDALKVTVAELAKLKSKPVKAEELRRAKDFVRGKMVLHLEDSTELAEWFARQELLEGRTETPEQKLARIEAVTAADVQAVARDLLLPNRATLAMIGPAHDHAQLTKIIGNL
jgi:predicted Zn-dependent peptidase